MRRLPKKLEQSSGNFLKNRRRTICLNYRLYYNVLSINDGEIPFNSTDVAKKAAIGILNTRNCFSSEEGVALKAKMLAIKQLYMTLKPADTSRIAVTKSRDFIAHKFMSFYKNHGEEFKKTLVCDLLQYLIKTMEGQHNTKCGNRIMDFIP